MKQSLRVTLVGLTCCVCVLRAQSNFGGTDDFSSVVVGNWTADVVEGTGSPGLTVSGDALQLTGGPLAIGESGRVYRDWALNAGAVNADWTVYADFNLNFTPGSLTHTVEWALFAFNPADTHNEYAYVSMTWNFTQLMSGFPLLESKGAIAGSESAIGSARTASASTATLGISYDASNQWLITGYDLNGSLTGGLNFEPFGVFDISAWGLTSGDTFGARIFAESRAGSSALSGGFGSGASVDDFTALSTAAITAAAVPEPANFAGWLAAWAGLFVLACRRRR